jgi:hypothetical protein
MMLPEAIVNAPLLGVWQERPGNLAFIAKLEALRLRPALGKWARDRKSEHITKVRTHYPEAEIQKHSQGSASGPKRPAISEKSERGRACT